MKLLFCFLFAIVFSTFAFSQVPTGTRQRSTDDTLIKKPVPKPVKYNPKSNKWPKQDSLKNKPSKNDSAKRKPPEKTRLKQNNNKVFRNET
ncbi:hypothetical protein [Pedobacter sp. Leaf176]|uniref:hypothetical protein n=1 Tax=Pedobacter sp. Leaf176 TaxID=1736286 RepID=UPI0007006FED|nr:hypothetical protein [Pedobacter sp. Leaf176]KQR70401.1 hypothetical protein ASF92_10490 [Pedobacter sp. Leaf176]